MAALKCKGPKARTNFDVSRYAALMPFLESVSMDELVMAIRRQSAGFARGTSVFRGVTHHPNGRWEARLGVPGQRHVYLGLFPNEDAAARAYDRALVRLRGVGAATNFPLSEYATELAAYEASHGANGNEQVALPAPAGPPGDSSAHGGADGSQMRALFTGTDFGMHAAGSGADDPLLQAVIDGNGAWLNLDYFNL